jgi:nicotinamidase/pyrazinamidase
MKITKYNFLASLDIDAQQCFTPICNNELPVLGGEQIATELNKQAEYASFRIGSKDAHSPHALWVTDIKEQVCTAISQEQTAKYKDIDLYWPVHAVPGTPGFELIPGLPRPNQYDFFVWKGIEIDMHPYGACYHDLAEQMSTGLIEYLQSKNITHIIAGGLSLDYCVKTTVLQLVQAGFKVMVNLAATRGLTENTSLQAKRDMLAKGIILITNSEELPKKILKEIL